MRHYLWMLVVGIIDAAIARLFMPGSEHIGNLTIGTLGIAGSLVGGVIANLFSRPADGALVHPENLLFSAIAH
jgi:uncharacterized membrane protein YeaQ/YmgE (transglycosylase-associated protein family)